MGPRLTLTREQLRGPGVRVLNRGGLVNPDVLLVEEADEPGVVVKDYAARSAPVRWLVGPCLVRRELRILERLRDVTGVPGPVGRVDRLALAMQYVEGRPLRRRIHRGRLPPQFFDELERILDDMAERGLIYTDLRSPSNIVATPEGRPVLVDLASALRLPVPRWLRKAAERPALAKLRSRFSGEPSGEPDTAPHSLKLSHTRISFRDAGALSDPTPLICLHDWGLSSAAFVPLLRSASSRSRRVIAPDLPGFGDSRYSTDLSLGSQAETLLEFLDAMRVQRLELLGQGWGAWLAGELAKKAAERVVQATALPGLLEEPSPGGPSTLPTRLRAGLPPDLDPGMRRELEWAIDRVPISTWAEVARRIGAVSGQPRGRVAVEPGGWSLLAEPQAVWQLLDGARG